MNSLIVNNPRLPRLSSLPRRRQGRAGLVAAGMVAAVVLLPILTIIAVALTSSGEDWPHLLRYVLPNALSTTFVLLLMVGVGTSVIGVATAWLVVAYDFPLRRFMAWALVLPLAVPPYLAAYAHAEFFHFVGPVQSMIRAWFGFTRPADYWFPDIRSTWGAALVLASVTYPYVYLTTRVVFLMQGRNIADVARTLGAGPSRVFWRVLLPVARPAIAAGVALVLMETLNDFGAVQHLGVNTLTFAVYSTWLNRGSLEGAAQIALVMLVFVIFMIVMEQGARHRQRFHSARATQMKARPPRIKLGRWASMGAIVATGAPLAFGFGIPLYIFTDYAANRLHQFADPRLVEAFVTTVVASSATAIVAVGAAIALIFSLRMRRSRWTLALTRIATAGYAMPGTILALGLLLSLARFDNTLDSFLRAQFGISSGLILSGTAAAVVLGCAIRFLALAEGAVQSGLMKLPPNIDEAARSLGKTAAGSARAVLLPLVRPAIATAAILVFVDTAKELSATILLRPFGFNTLATHVYENASRGAVEEGAVAALMIVVTAMVPVILLSGRLMQDRDA
ncbi:ABC transporter permease [Nitratireductor basaltis]|uniref:Binding-protein-dependent transport systems inner membrane component n=1 Tax=Nitratireductor basaltis TaxID=472175 RepID=A0A084UDR7_9HYPH|nr:iron ABC transporter permease [Nitratireductor basaltis]KFB11103.1 Binding-protein-dependent transport systems inner membrane component [Nitratireductor basaltis]